MSESIALVQLETVRDDRVTLFDRIRGRFGGVPNLFRMIGNSGSGLATYVGIAEGLDRSTLEPGVRERIALAVSEVNGCVYCLSAHQAIGGSVGLDRQDIADARRGLAADPKIQAILTLARLVVETRGHVPAADLDAVRTAGVTDAEVIEVIAQVAHDTFTNYVAIATQTPSEFPPAAPLIAERAA